MKDNLHAVVAMIEKFNSAYLVEDGIIGIVGLVVSNDGGQGILFKKCDVSEAPGLFRKGVLLVKA